MLKSVIASLVITAAFAFSGCKDDSHQHGTSTSTNAGSSSTQAAVLPADLFSDAPLTGATSLLDVRESAKAGDEVTFVAAIGGRANPFIDGRAVMVVSDLALAFCTDGCAIPWDACCEPPENVAKHTATVQVVDESGNPLRVGLQSALKAGSQIQVSGVVHQAEEGAYVVNANKFHVTQ